MKKRMLEVLNVKAVIEYDGTDFHGFQRQPRLRTVQGELEKALASLFQGKSCRVIGAGRTDAGVHATGQAINFPVPDSFPVERLHVAINSVLPIDVKVRSTEVVPADFHARYSAKSRKYTYIVLNRESPSALLARYTWHLRKPLDIGMMKKGADSLVGVKDFASFGMPDRKGGSTLREIFDIRIGRKNGAVIFHITANAFLRGMARAMVGTLVDIGRERIGLNDIINLLVKPDRCAVKVTAPPRGLYLTRVEY